MKIQKSLSSVNCSFGGGKKLGFRKKKIKNPPLVCRFCDPRSLGKKHTLNLEVKKQNRWWFRHPRQRIQVEHVCFLKKTMFDPQKIRLKQPHILLLFFASIQKILVLQNKCFQKKHFSPSIKSSFFSAWKPMNPSPQWCQERSPDHTPGAINSPSHCRSERAQEGCPSPSNVGEVGVEPKIGEKPQNEWFISWKTLWTNGWFGGKTPIFRNTQVTTIHGNLRGHCHSPQQIGP